MKQIRQLKACSFDDDFSTIAPTILEADAVAFIMPVCRYSIPAQISPLTFTLKSVRVSTASKKGGLRMNRRSYGYGYYRYYYDSGALSCP